MVNTVGGACRIHYYSGANIPVRGNTNRGCGIVKSMYGLENQLIIKSTTPLFHPLHLSSRQNKGANAMGIIGYDRLTQIISETPVPVRIITKPGATAGKF